MQKPTVQIIKNEGAASAPWQCPVNVRAFGAYATADVYASAFGGAYVSVYVFASGRTMLHEEIADALGTFVQSRLRLRGAYKHEGAFVLTLGHA